MTIDDVSYSVRSKVKTVLSVVSDIQGDWEAVYANGRLVLENHSVSAAELGVKLVGVTVSEFEHLTSPFSQLGRGLPLLSDYTDLALA